MPIPSLFSRRKTSPLRAPIRRSVRSFLHSHTHPFASPHTRARLHLFAANTPAHLPRRAALSQCTYAGVRATQCRRQRDFPGAAAAGETSNVWQLQRERPLWHLWVERPSVLGVQVVMPREFCPCVIQCLAPPSGEPSPGADVRGGEPSPGADVGGASPVLVRMWHTAGAYCLAPLIAVSCPN